MEFFDDKGRYSVVVNGANQHSVWPDARPLIPGWTLIGFSGTQAECFEKIDELEADMSQASLKEQ